MSKETVILLFLISIALQSNLANSFLDDCPIDTEMRVGSERIVDILETFYDDLEYFQAATDLRQTRFYSRFFREVDAHWSAYSRETYTFFLEVMKLLLEDRFKQAESLMAKVRFLDLFTGRQKTYYQFFKAEIKRLLGNGKEAAVAILMTYMERHHSEGVSVNDLERLDGLIALQKMSQFNLNVDRMHGLRHSPDYQVLSWIHMMTKGEMVPLKDLRLGIYHRLFRMNPKLRLSENTNTSQVIETSYEMTRTFDRLDDFSGSSVPKTSAEQIMCEFARKLEALGVSSPAEAEQSDYDDVLDQLRQLDPEFANRLNARVVTNILTGDIERAKINANEMWGDRLNSPFYDEVQETFMSYFSAELNRRSEERCNAWTLHTLQEDLDTITQIRMVREGLSLDKIVDLEGRIMVLWLHCFHKRVKLAYQLDGTEDEQQLLAKRAEFGTCEHRLPSDAIGVRTELV